MKKKERKRNFTDDYTDLVSMREKPFMPAAYTRLANEAVAFFEERPDAIMMEEFFVHRKISPSFWSQRCKEIEDIGRANEYLLLLLGTRREKAAINKKMSENIVAFTMPVYHKRWRDILALRAEAQQVQAEIPTAAIPTIPLTDDVKKQLESKDNDNNTGSVSTP